MSGNGVLNLNTRGAWQLRSHRKRTSVRRLSGILSSTRTISTPSISYRSAPYAFTACSTKAAHQGLERIRRFCRISMVFLRTPRSTARTFAPRSLLTSVSQFRTMRCVPLPAFFARLSLPVAFLLDLQHLLSSSPRFPPPYLLVPEYARDMSCTCTCTCACTCACQHAHATCHLHMRMHTHTHMPNAYAPGHATCMHVCVRKRAHIRTGTCAPG